MVEAFPHMKCFDLANCVSVSDAGWRSLSNLPSLEVLLLFNTQIDDAGILHIAKLASLTTLSLSYSRITDSALQYLSNLKSLRVLRISNTQISDAALQHLVHLPLLDNLGTFKSNVTKEGLESFWKQLNKSDSRQQQQQQQQQKLSSGLKSKKLLPVIDASSVLTNYHDMKGVGTFGVVYSGFWHERQCKVAIKTFSPQNQQDALTEAENCTGVTHKNIVQFHGVLQNDNNPNQLSLVFELAECSLRHKLINTRFTLKECYSVLLQIASGLAFLHKPDDEIGKQCILHFDLKPENILLFDNGAICKLCDFGTNMKVTERSMTTVRAFTPCYCPPEFNANSQFGAKATTTYDVFSFGVIAFELLTSARNPHLVCQVIKEGKIESGFVRTEKHCNGEADDESVVEVNDCNRFATSELWKLAAQCVHFDPAQRFRDGQAIVNALATSFPIDCQESGGATASLTVDTDNVNSTALKELSILKHMR
jgi:hypothetical protein